MMNQESVLDHTKRRKAVWRIEALIFDEDLAKEIKHRAIDDGVTYGEMFLTGLKMYLMQGREPVKKTKKNDLP